MPRYHITVPQVFFCVYSFVANDEDDAKRKIVTDEVLPYEQMPDELLFEDETFIAAPWQIETED
jgi:hypothetical protein